MPNTLRAVLYFIFLLYLFLGIAIIADIFMSAIETITSRRRKIKYPDPEKKDKYLVVEVRLWNDTVANLTLMALGSSSPEILLSIIEIVGNRFEAGELGPGTSKKSIFSLPFLLLSRTKCQTNKGRFNRLIKHHEGHDIRIRTFIATRNFYSVNKTPNSMKLNKREFRR